MLLKRIVDYNVKAPIKVDGTGVDLPNVKMSMNPFDEIAVEEAIRLKEAERLKRLLPISDWW
jgi:electron transfer flavoprotein beta subunit